MAIVNIDMPELVSLARSPVQVKLASNLPTAAFPINWLKWEVTGSPAAGETVTIGYGDVSVGLEVLAVADDSGHSISEQGALSLADYAQQLVEELQANYLLFSSFLIEYDLQGATHRVLFKPRGSTDLSWSFTSGLSNITVEIFQAENLAYKENQGILLLVEPYNKNTGVYDTPFPHVLPILESSANVVFDIHTDFMLGPSLPPANSIGSGGDFIIECVQNWAKYRLYYAEQSGNPVTAQALSSDGKEYFALFGGNDFFNQFNSFWGFWENNGKFLTAAPRVQLITYEQPLWLYWVGRAVRTVEISVKAYHRSGAESTYTRDSYAEQIGEVIAIKAGFTQLQLPGNDADPIVKYEVWLESSSAAVSEVFTFKVTGQCAEFTRYFLFANSLGGCDTVRATGKHLTKIDTITQDGSRIIDDGTIADGLGEDFHYNRRSRALFEGSVGYKSAEYVAYLQDLLNAPAAWLVDVGRGRFNPLLIDAGSTDLLKDGEDLYTLRFRYRHAWEEAHAGITDDGQRIIIETDLQGPDIP